MAGFLNALSFITPVAQTIGPEMQIGAREAQRQSSEEAFDKLLDQAGGPELDPFRQYRKAGATAAQTSSAMSSEIGKDILQKYSVHRMSEIMAGPDFKQNLTTAAGEGLIPWKDVLTFLKDPTKAPPLMPEDLKAGAQQFLDSNPGIPDDEHRYIQGAIDNNNYAALKDIHEKVIPSYMGSTLYSTRGYNIIGYDSDGRQFIERFNEHLRGGPAKPQVFYPDDNSPVPPDKMNPMKGAKLVGSFPDGGGYGDDEGGYGGFGGTGGGGGFTPFGAGPSAAAPPGAPNGAGPAGTGAVKPGGGASSPGSGIASAPSDASAAAPSGKPQVMKFLKMSEAEAKTAHNIQALLPQLAHLDRTMDGVQNRWDRDVASRVFSKWVAQKLDILPGTDPLAAQGIADERARDFLNNNPDYQKLQVNDPELAAAMSELITVDAMSSVSLLAASGVRNLNLLGAFGGHIMEPNGNYASIKINIRKLNAMPGPYRSWLQSVGVTRPSTPNPPDDIPSRNRPVPASPPGPPPSPPPDAAGPVTWDTTYGKWKYKSKTKGWQYSAPD